MLPKIIMGIGAVAITIILIAAQKYLSKRRTWQLGAIIPLLSFAAMVVLYFTMQLSFSVGFVVSCVIILAVEIFIWIEGRQQFRKEALNRMKAKDIDG